MLPAWLKAWLWPFCRLKPAWRTMPSVMPETAGPIAAPAIAVATWDSVTSQKLCESKTMPEAITVQMPGMMT